MKSEAEIRKVLEKRRYDFEREYPQDNDGNLIEIDEDGNPLTTGQWMGAAWSEGVIAVLEWILDEYHFDVIDPGMIDIVSARE
jgi:hypothetical protein